MQLAPKSCVSRCLRHCMLAGGALLSSASATQAQAPQVLELETRTATVRGLPIHWTSLEAVILESSGRMHLLDQAVVESYQLQSETFQPQALIAARSELQFQMGRSFETIIAGPYVIAAPRGQAERWRDRFLALLAGYSRYFQVRGTTVRKPDFPLPVIVCRNRQEFLRMSAFEGDGATGNVVGSYFPRSNRCLLYQLPGTQGTNWEETEATIVHEAVHQLAYNTGLHERLFANPLWCVEGLACMFETPAVYDLSVSQSSIANRMNPGLARIFREEFQETAILDAAIRDLIVRDDFFRKKPEAAYALAWALTFYLSERLPGEYQKLLRSQTQHGFGEYTAGQRMQDFRAAISMDPRMLAIQMQRLLAE
ncbi:DUF1570 domain-containing protein [Aureliella helgolandensis]|uniref:DUF1570 domain-containing protein n=1 Tax=Aureliella helgolandensis TaxID=2527968 RepID=A0A518GC99_9BACT|nr:DUF1570 domain-containing protein [Aureliella helgolandensis]QDV26224.1 hypothetical protein Q31a_45960 [Aureliella helgolandensis]